MADTEEADSDSSSTDVAIAPSLSLCLSVSLSLCLSLSFSLDSCARAYIHARARLFGATRLAMRRHQPLQPLCAAAPGNKLPDLPTEIVQNVLVSNCETVCSVNQCDESTLEAAYVAHFPSLERPVDFQDRRTKFKIACALKNDANNNSSSTKEKSRKLLDVLHHGKTYVMQKTGNLRPDPLWKLVPCYVKSFDNKRVDYYDLHTHKPSHVLSETEAPPGRPLQLACQVFFTEAAVLEGIRPTVSTWTATRLPMFARGPQLCTWPDGFGPYNDYNYRTISDRLRHLFEWTPEAKICSSLNIQPVGLTAG
ncbi:MAG: hypothetical protein CMI16_07195 [Opitutaceae bacterium]|nr:hypothetical protein [Opitutaceae bacterium]